MEFIMVVLQSTGKYSFHADAVSIEIVFEAILLYTYDTQGES